jgi:hypothetical protein
MNDYVETFAGTARERAAFRHRSASASVAQSLSRRSQSPGAFDPAAGFFPDALD